MHNFNDITSQEIIEHVTSHIHTDTFQDLKREQERDIDNTR